MSRKSDPNSPTSSFKEESLRQNRRLFQLTQDLSAKINECSIKLTGHLSRIDSNNCLQVLELLSDSTLGDNPSCLPLHHQLVTSLQKLENTNPSWVNKLVLFRDMLFEGVTPLSEVSNILKDIKQYLLKNANPLTSACLQSLYSFLLARINSTLKPEDLKQEIKEVIKVFNCFLSQAIFYIFRCLFYLHEKKGLDILGIIQERLVPILVTETPQWKHLYPKIIKVLGRRSLKVLKEEQPSYFQIQQAFNCQSCANPFIRTIVNLQQLDSSCSIKHKLRVLGQLPVNMKLDIQDHQQSTILETNVPFGHEDMIPCLEYCIMKSDRPGLIESIECIEMFYAKPQGVYQQNLLEKKGVSHWMDFIKAAGMYLRKRDTELSLIQPGPN